MVDLQRVFSKRIGGLDFGRVDRPYKFTLIMNKKREFQRQNPGRAVLDLGLGEPDRPPAERCLARLTAEMRDKRNLMYPFRGPADFRAACADYVKRLCGVQLDPEQEIIHVGGAKAALAALPFSFLDPGDSIIATAPGYPVMPAVAAWLGAKVTNLSLRPELGFLPDLTELEDAVKREQPKIVLLNYPNNPTGAVANLDLYRAVVELAHRYRFIIVQDAPYADFVYDGVYVSPFQVDGGREVTIEVHSFSKTFNMQGFRIGFIAAAPLLMKAYTAIRDTIDSGQFIPIQRAAIEAMQHGEETLRECKERYRARQRRAVEGLQSVGIPAALPPGTPYLFCRVPQRFDGREFTEATEFCCHLVETRGIATVPFESAGGQFFRLSMMFDTSDAGHTSDEAFIADMIGRLAGRGR